MAQDQIPRSPSLTELRRLLHRTAELSGRESRTAETVTEFLHGCAPDGIITGIGGNGVAAVFGSTAAGPAIMFRCELDALPIPDSSSVKHASISPGVSHKCGHDGHMAIACGVARGLADRPLTSGTVVLLFQPSEETGEGARRVLSDPKFIDLHPDLIFSLHNLPGYAQGEIVVREGPFASASVGMVIDLHGSTAHASQPASGRSPALALADLIKTFAAVPQHFTALHESAQVTVIHARLGERAFGTSPGEATLMATLRAHETPVLEQLKRNCAALSRSIAAAYDLTAEVETTEDFPATVNHKLAVDMIRSRAEELRRPLSAPAHPFPWSEDFGNFLERIPGALFGIGSGEEHPVLHHPDYDFPDALIEPAVVFVDALLRAAVRER